jgi:hypothetical protein
VSRPRQLPLGALLYLLAPAVCGVVAFLVAYGAWSRDPERPGTTRELAERPAGALAAVRRYYRLLDAGRGEDARGVLAGDARQAATTQDLEANPYAAARVETGEVQGLGDAGRARVALRSLVTVRERDGCVARRGGELELARVGGAWRITSFARLGRPRECDCTSLPTALLPVPGRRSIERAPAAELRRVPAAQAFVTSPTVGVRRPQALTPEGRVRWTVPGTGEGFDVTLALERRSDVRCVSLYLGRARDGARVSTVTLTSPAREPVTLALAPADGVQWLKRDFGVTDDVTVHIDDVTPEALTAPPPLVVQVWGR